MARRGDWVRFQHDGRLVIGQVEYVRPRQSWEDSDTLVTDAGEIDGQSVLEVRSAKKRAVSLEDR